MTVLATGLVPFTRTHTVHTVGLRTHALWLLGSGVDGLAPLCEEFLWLDRAEREHVITVCGDVAAGRPLMPCVWSAVHGEVAALAAHAESCGATAVILPPPLVDPVGPDAMIAWYQQATAAVRIPVLAWTHPAFGNDLSTGLLGQLARQAGVAGIVDSYGDPHRLRRLAALFPGQAWAGDDAAATHLRADGLAGMVSRCANLWPELAHRLWTTDDDVGEAWRVRAQTVARAGGVGAMKHALRLGARAPQTGWDGEYVHQLPEVSFR